MVDTSDNKELYDKIAEIQAKEGTDAPATNEEKEAALAKLAELANSSMEFDADRIESIRAFAAGFANNANAEAILKRIDEQAKVNTSAEKQQEDNTNQTQQIDIENVPSYSAYKEYEALKGKEELSDAEKKRMVEIEQYSSKVLDNIDAKNITPEASVALQDYMDIAYLANPEASKEKYQELQNAITAKLTEYDHENGLENASAQTPEEMQANETAWGQVATNVDIKPALKELNPILSELPKEQQAEILKTLQRTTIFDLKDKTPDENGVKTMQDTLDSNAAEFGSLVKAEYLKQQAKAEFCEQNKIKPEELDALLLKNAKGEELNEEEKATVAKLNNHTADFFKKSQNFNGPYDNKEFLKNAVETTRAQLISRSVTKESRRARLMNAPDISSRVATMNNNFALNHPKAYKAANLVKTIGLNALRTAAISATLGPVGLTAYSAYKTFKTIRKAYKEHQEKEGGNFKDFVKSLAKPENRSKALTLAGQIAATAISGYFSLNGGLEGVVDNLGGVGKALHATTGLGTDHIVDAASHASQHIDSVGDALQAGATKIWSSPRRAISMATSLGIGVVKGLSEKYNLNKARKNMTKILEANGVAVDKKLLKAFEKAQEPEQFQALLQQYTPNISQEQAQELLNNADLARKSNPKSIAAATIGGAAIGLVAASATEAYFSHNAEGNLAANTDNNAPTAPSADELGHAADDMWAKGGDKRFESFGIDAEDANKMLREMGVIKEGDHTFYRQSGLTKLVNEANLTNEQRGQIQAWANDRESRVSNMMKCIREHHHGGHGTRVSTQSLGNQNAPIDNSNTPEGTPQPVENNTPQQDNSTKYHVEGVINKKNNINGDVEANNPLSAASAVAHENGANGAKRSKFIVTDEHGNQTDIKSKVGSRTTVVKATYHKGDAENGEVVSKQKIKSYTSGKSEGSTKIVEHRDIDGDGKKDRIETVMNKDGSSVQYAKLSTGDRVLSTDDGQGNKASVSANEKAGHDGTGKSTARRALKSSFNTLRKHLMGRD